METFKIDYIELGPQSDCTSNDLPREVSYNIESKETFYLAIGSLGTIFSKTNTKKPLEGTGEFSMGLNIFYIFFVNLI